MFRAKWGALREFPLVNFYIIIPNSNFDFFFPFIFTLITYHFVVINATSDICQINPQNISGCSVVNSRIKRYS
jgi:hypothetical protein